MAVITNGHRINQKCFNDLKLNEDNPWMMNCSGTYLLFDTVHIIKCIRNNLLTEKSQEIQYNFRGVTKVARWNDLELLFKAEANSLITLSRLNETTVLPKPMRDKTFQLA